MRYATMALVSVFVCSMAFADCPEAEQKNLEELDRSWGEASRNGDRAALAAIFADDYADTSLAGGSSKAQAIDSAVRAAAQAANSGSSQSYDHYVITCTPASALLTHRVTTTNGRGQKSYFRSVHALEKRGGKWMVVSNAGHPLTAQEEILYMEHDWSDADRKRDMAWFENNFADNFVGISSRNGAVRSKQDEIAEMRSSKESMDFAQSSDMNVHVDGNTAVVTGLYQTRGKDEQGKAVERKIRFTDTYVKRDGRWQVLSSQGTNVTQ
jgi:ketosteroid isomerase-like protein